MSAKSPIQAVDPSSPFRMDRLYRDTSLANETPTFDLSGLTPAGAVERETSTSNSFRKITITVTAGDLTAGTWTFTSQDGLVVATINYDDDCRDNTIQAASRRYVL